MGIDLDTEDYLLQSEKAEAVFKDKLKDYGPSWRVFRLLSIADQIFIKAYRIRTIQDKKVQKVEDCISDDFLGIYNYGLIAYIQYSHPDLDEDWESLDKENAEQWYKESQEYCFQVFQKKNHDYGNAWKQLSLEGITDLILTKILRIRQILFNKDHILKSEDVESHFIDIANYAIFASIKL